ncbi:MAG: hypothetical protein M3512_10455 [Bacteroidota bacterium]|nr:hypothetical protein [Bacteroidota bacterium]
MEKEERLQIFDSLLDKDLSWTIILITNDPNFLEKCDRTIDLSQKAVGVK